MTIGVQTPVFGHHAILGLAGTDEWIHSLVEHVWDAIAADRQARGTGDRR